MESELDKLAKAADGLAAVAADRGELGAARRAAASALALVAAE
jgi:hypothetical protein